MVLRANISAAPESLEDEFAFSKRLTLEYARRELLWVGHGLDYRSQLGPKFWFQTWTRSLTNYQGSLAASFLAVAS